ncbi:MAG: universal stress protein [Nitrosopumilus sp.]|nr:universal stress protein [Nitrosopumilus sp.]MDH3854628.1 universal stress protein [Nitrosopumilus sp.]
MISADAFSNILVTYVKPTNKETAFDMGLSLAKSNNAKLSVVEFMQAEQPEFLFFKSKNNKKKENEQKHLVEDALKKFEEKAKQENVDLKTSFKSTETLVDSIIQYVESNKIDLLIVDHPHMSHSEETHYNDVVSAIHDEVHCNMLTLK